LSLFNENTYSRGFDVRGWKQSMEGDEKQ